VQLSQKAKGVIIIIIFISILILPATYGLLKTFLNKHGGINTPARDSVIAPQKN
jgi:hypothetical protein